MSIRLKFNQILGLGIMALMLYGCAQNNIIWEKYGSTQQELDKDKRECLRVAQVVIPPSPYVAPQGQMVSGWYVQPQWTEYLAAMKMADSRECNISGLVENKFTRQLVCVLSGRQSTG